MGWLSRCLSLGSPTREEGGTAMEDSKCRNASPSAVMSAECLVRTVGLSASGSVTSEATRGRSQRMVVTVPRLRAVRWASRDGARPDAGHSWVLRQDGQGKEARGRQSRRGRGNGRGDEHAPSVHCHTHIGQSHVEQKEKSEDQPPCGSW